MDAKSLHFSAYDVLGYMVPGLALLALVDCSVAFHGGGMQLTYEAITTRYTSIPWKGAVALLLVSYYVGHLISFASSMTIERHARWCYGHPMRFLLDGEINYPGYFAAGGKTKNWSRLLRGLTGLALLPIAAFEFILLRTGIIKNYIRSMGPEFNEAVGKALQALCAKAKMKRNPSREYPAEVELLAIHYTLESAPAHIHTLRNYVVLYGFLRSMTLVLVVFTCAAALHVGLAVALKFGSFQAIGSFAAVLLGCGLFCTVSYGAFLKFWARYNREALMGLTAVYLRDAQETPTRRRSRRKPTRNRSDDGSEPEDE